MSWLLALCAVVGFLSRLVGPGRVGSVAFRAWLWVPRRGRFPYGCKVRALSADTLARVCRHPRSLRSQLLSFFSRYCAALAFSWCVLASSHAAMGGLGLLLVLPPSSFLGWEGNNFPGVAPLCNRLVVVVAVCGCLGRPILSWWALSPVLPLLFAPTSSLAAALAFL